MLGVGALSILIGGCGLVAPDPPSSMPSGVLSGVVRAAPSCPVERLDHPCPPRPVQAALVQALQRDRVVAQQRTTAGGVFTFRLPAGDYLLRATNAGGYESTTEQLATVATGRKTRVTLVLDSGIR
ncbi:MAG: carboxypeptidase-like regulatory domain-containing protein [Actinomycetota bacterium]|nr:carboxypeptidase-like regulatory domain-containing protein [Actinomycetota bacterium]